MHPATEATTSIQSALSSRKISFTTDKTTTTKVPTKILEILSHELVLHFWNMTTNEITALLGLSAQQCI